MPTVARSLAEDLRQRSDGALEDLLRLRPQLARPVPKSFADLALRANSAAATLAALDDLNRAELAVLEAACALAPGGVFDRDALCAGLGESSDSPAVLGAVDSLMTRALFWGTTTDVRVPSAAREAMGRRPGGLDPVSRGNVPAVRNLTRDPDALRRAVQEAPAPVRALIATVLWGPPDLAAGRSEEEIAAADWLMDNGFLVTDESGNRTLIREAALVLREGRLLREPDLHPPAPEPPDAGRAAAILTASGHAADQWLRTADRVMSAITHQPPATQANGSLTARDWDRTAGALGLSDTDLALALDLLWSCGWMDRDSARRMVPTTLYLSQLDRPRAERWASLVLGWLGSDRLATARPNRPLGHGDEPGLPAERCLVLAAATTHSGRQLLPWLEWHRPRTTPSAATIAATVEEGQTIGVMALGRTAVTAAASADCTLAELTAGIEPHLPALASHVVVQADLTATALGPLEPAIERRLLEIADHESGGAATVFRFSQASVRRALAAGADAPGTLAWLTSVSSTPLPQALTVLLGDVAAAMPVITVLPASAVVLCDEVTATAIAGDPQLADAGLRSVAPGVISAAMSQDELTRRLRAAGYVIDPASATVAPVATDRPRTRQQPAPPTARIIRSLRNVDGQAPLQAPPPEILSTAGPATILDHLRKACADHSRLWLEFSADDGSRQTHLVEPLSIAEGDFCAFDVTAVEIRTIPLERIVALSPS